MIVDIGLKTKKNNPKIAIALPQKKYTERKAVKKKAIKTPATTYSRTSSTSTTIGNAAFDGRVRDGIGSGHCFRVTGINWCLGISFID